MTDRSRSAEQRRHERRAVLRAAVAGAVGTVAWTVPTIRSASAAQVGSPAPVPPTVRPGTEVNDPPAGPTGGVGGGGVGLPAPAATAAALARTGGVVTGAVATSAAAGLLGVGLRRYARGPGVGPDGPAGDATAVGGHPRPTPADEPGAG